MKTFLLPLLSLIVGASLGLFSSLLISSIRQRHTVTLRLLDQFFEVRKEVVDILSELVDIPRHKYLEEQELDDYRRAVSKLYFKHYDFLPPQVVEALLILHASIIDGTGKLYKLHNGAVIPRPFDEYSSFINECSRFRNTRIYAKQALESKRVETRRNEAIKIHAQNVLYNLNKFASRKDLLAMTKNLRKDIELSLIHI